MAILNVYPSKTRAVTSFVIDQRFNKNCQRLSRYQSRFAISSSKKSLRYCFVFELD